MKEDIRIFSYLPNPRVWKSLITAKLISINVNVIGDKPRNLPEWTPLYKKLGLKVYSDREVQVRGIENVTREALKIVSPDGKSPYISVDIDAIDPAFAPGTNSAVNSIPTIAIFNKSVFNIAPPSERMAK